ncbi:MAG: hypothetical protein ACK56I_34880, partial [bacterium]
MGSGGRPRHRVVGGSPGLRELRGQRLGIGQAAQHRLGSGEMPGSRVRPQVQHGDTRVTSQRQRNL